MTRLKFFLRHLRAVGLWAISFIFFFTPLSLCREDGAIILSFQVVLGVCVCVPKVFINEIQSTFQKSQSIKCCFFSLGVPVCHGHYHAEHTFHF